MADSTLTSLPVRTATNGDVVVQIVDGTTITQKLSVDTLGRLTIKLDDGSGNAITSQVNGAQRALDVGINVSGAQIDPRQIRALTSADIVTANQGTSPWVENLAQVGGSAIALGQTTMVASLPVTIASNQTALPVTQSTSPWITKDQADGSASGGTAGSFSLLAGAIYNSTPLTLTNGQQAGLQSDANGYLNVDLKTAIPAGTNLIGAVNLDLGGSPVSNTNPVPVTITSTSPGIAIQDYHTSAALAVAASVTFTYTVVAAHTFNLARIWSSATGKIKTVIQNTGSTIMVGFNSTANPNIDMTIVAQPTIAAGNTVTVTITNEDILAFDVYATIEGNQN